MKLSASDDEARLLCDGVSEAIRAALAIQGGFTLLTDADKADMVVEGVMHARETRYRTMIRLVDREKQEIGIIQGFLPRPMSAEKMTEAVAAVLAETGASSLKDMGRTMALLRERHAGQMDFAAASAMLKERLNAG